MDGSSPVKKLLAAAMAAGLLLGGASLATAAPGNGLGPRPDGEVGPRCLEALEHALAQGNGSHKGIEDHAMDNCQRAVDRFADRGAEEE
jgi:hypothetical protein